MALPITPKPTYPNVPRAPGVPPILRQIGNVQNTVVLLVADLLILANSFQGPQWGIFDQNRRPIIVGSSVVEMGYRNESRISTAPQENGAFLSYNKVSDPFDARITFTQGGKESDRTAFLASVDSAQKSLYLFWLVTPEVTYQSMNITHYDYRRTQRQGTTLLTVDVWLQQVRVIKGQKFTKTAAPSGQDPVNDGPPQPQTPTTGQDSALRSYGRPGAGP